MRSLPFGPKPNAVRRLLDPHDSVARRGELLEHQRLMAWHDQMRIGREQPDAILRLQIAGDTGVAVDGLRYRDVLLEILVQVDVVRGEDRGAAVNPHADVL